MNAEWVREFCLGLPHVVETMQWGAHLLFWAGDKAIGGKMFAIVNLEGDGRALLSYPAGPERYPDLVEIEGIIPAPHLARIHWVAVERWDVFRRAEWERELRAAYEITCAKLPQRTKSVLALPAKERRQIVAARKKLLADREAKKKRA